MHLGRVTHLYRYPTKSLAAEELQAAEVAPDGFENDRIQALHVASGGHARTGKPYRGKEDNQLHLLARIDDAIALGKRRGLELSPAGAGRHFDAAPVSLILDTWLRDAGVRCGIELEPLRFRPNIVVAADAAFVEGEAALVGAELRIDGVRLRVIDQIRRCVTPTYDVRTGESNPAILRTIAQERENVMGVYCTVQVPGRIVLGAGCERL